MGIAHGELSDPSVAVPHDATAPAARRQAAMSKIFHIDVPQDGTDQDGYNGDLAGISSYLQTHHPNKVVKIVITRSRKYKSEFKPEDFADERGAP